MMKGVVLWFAAVQQVWGEVINDRVLELPGAGRLDARHWSGYIGVPLPWLNTTAYVHYWLMENAKRAVDAPTAAWFQGGPGGSSLIGLLTENGPYTLNDFSVSSDGGPPKVFENPFSYHNLFNMLYVEHPAPTGFSYCEPNPCHWNDTSQAWASYGFMERFFQAYPEFSSTGFHMLGESYAGVLVPTLAYEIKKHRTESNKHRAPWSLAGFALGNACPGNRVFTCTPYSGWIGTQVAVDFRYFHGMISDKTYKAIQAACEGQWGTYEPPSSRACRDLLEDPINPVLSEAGTSDNMGGGYFLYDTCKTDLAERAALDVSDKLASPLPLPSPNSGEYYCGQERVSQIWLNRADVQDALHVRRTNFSFSTDLNYTFTAHSLLELYRTELVDSFDILQFSGDADPCVPYIGTQRWVDSLELPTERPWRPWSNPENQGQPAGYMHVMKSYNQRHLFTFATIRDAGHMSMRYKPAPSLYLLQQYLKRYSN